MYNGNPEQIAKIDQWLDWQATTFNSSWNYAFQAIVRKNSNYSDKKEIEKSMNNWNKAITILDNNFSKNKYSTGNIFKISDIVLALSLNRWYMTTNGIGKFQHVDRYYKDCSKITSFEKRVNNETP